MSLGEILITAGEFTLLGTGTVFLVLIIIALVISCFGVLKNVLKDKEPEAAPAVKAPAAPAAAAQTGDDQLIAVITAAIAAHMAEEQAEAPRDGEYVVRSIRRATWKHTLSE